MDLDGCSLTGPLRCGRGSRAAAALLLVLLWWGSAGADIAAADVGAGVQANPVTLNGVAEPGRSYALPKLLVVNTGSVTSTYRLRVDALSRDRAMGVPTGWVRFERNDVVLAPHAYAQVGLSLSLPASARRGQYLTDLVVGTVADAGRSGSRLAAGAQAATELRFTVGSARPTNWVWLERFGAAGLVLALTAGLVALQRRFRFKIRVERRE